VGVAYVNYVRGRAPVVTPYLEGRIPDSLLAVLSAGDFPKRLTKLATDSILYA